MASTNKSKWLNWGMMCAIVLVVAIAILGFLVINDGNKALRDESTQDETTSASRFAAEYSAVPKSNPFIYSSVNEVLEVFHEGTGLVYLGFPECPWCQQLAPILNQAALNQQLEQIYYLDIRQARQENDSDYQALVDYLSDHLAKDESGNPRIFVPDVTAIKDGKIVDRFVQEPADEEGLTPQTYWTAERRDRAINQLEEMISQIQPSQ